MNRRQRIRGIRSKSNPEKPCNVAFRDGQEAKTRGLSESACPYGGGDTYTTYLRAYWLNGFQSKDGINHHRDVEIPS